jgi:hypothetical protein
MADVVNTQAVSTNETVATYVTTSTPVVHEVKSSLAILFEIYSKLTGADLENVKQNAERQQVLNSTRIDVVNSIMNNIKEIAGKTADAYIADANKSILTGAMGVATGVIGLGFAGYSSYKAASDSAKFSQMKDEMSKQPIELREAAAANPEATASLIKSQGRDAQGKPIDMKSNYEHVDGKFNRHISAEHRAHEDAIKGMQPDERKEFAKVLDDQIKAVNESAYTKQNLIQQGQRVADSAAHACGSVFDFEKAKLENEKATSESAKTANQAADESLKTIAQNAQARVDESAQNIRNRDQLLQLASNLYKG